MGQAAAELQQGLLRVALGTAILLLPVISRRLVRPRVLQLEGEQRNAVDRQQQVKFKPGVGLRERRLPGERELVGGPLLVRQFAVGGRGLGIEQRQLDVIDLEFLPQHVNHTLSRDLAGQFFLNGLTHVLAALVLGQLVGLGRFEERPQAP